MSGQLHRILLATDGSEDAALARRAAADLARVALADLHVVHAWDLPTAPVAYPGYVAPPEWPRYYEEHARGVALREVQLLRDIGVDVTAYHVRRGRPVDIVLDLVENLGIGLVVMGSRGLGTVRRLVMGSVSEGVVHNAHVPVLVLRGGETAWPPVRVVAGDDGSPEAGDASRVGAEVARMLGASLSLVQAVPQLHEGDLAPGGPTADDLAERVRARLEARAAALEEILAGRPEVALAVGDPTVALLHAVDGAGGPALLAVGSRGLGGLTRMRVGSVSTKLLRSAHSPVLVAPRRAET